MGVPKPINLLDPRVDPLTDTDLFPARKPGAPPAQKTTLLQLLTYMTSKLTANNGVSKDLATGLITQLGQAVGRPGDPAALLNDVEIPNAGGFTVFFGKNDGVSNVVGINSDNGIDISNNTGNFLAFFDGTTNYTITAPAPGVFHVALGTQTLAYSNTTKALVWDNVFDTEGLRLAHRALATAIISPLQTDSVILIDTTAGNIDVEPDPAVVGKNIIYLKKTSADLNNVIIIPTSGTIQEIGAPAASFTFNVQGQTVVLYCDGTNFFIL